MPCPFPGMDPYLEHPGLWPDVHQRLVVAIANTLAPVLRPHYRVSVEQRVYVANMEGLFFLGRPDVSVMDTRLPVSSTVSTPAPTAVAEPVTVEVPLPDRLREGYLEVRDVATSEVVTVLEVLSPTNKRPGEGQRLYEEKRLQVLGTRTHLVEIDLLRGGEPMTMWGNGHSRHYRILVSRSERRPQADLYAFDLPQPIPSFLLPLRAGDEEPPVDLGALLHDLYDRAGYDLAVNYTAEPVPPLEGDVAAWADKLLREKGLR
jgi:hypothetical protein